MAKPKTIKHFGGNFTQIPNRLIRSDKISGNAKLVAIVIASFDPSYPSIRKIAKLTGFCRMTVIKYIKILEEHNVIKTDRSRRNNRYYMYWIGTTDVPIKTQRVQQIDPIGTADVPIKVQQMYPNNTKNNNKKKKGQILASGGNQKPGEAGKERVLSLVRGSVKTI